MNVMWWFTMFFFYYYFLYKSVSINNVFLHQGFMRSNDYLWVAILEASRVWGYQDGAPCLGYICRTIQNNVIIFRCIYEQSLFYHKRHSTLLYNNRINVSLRVNTNTAILPTRTQASSFTRMHCHTHAVSHARRHATSTFFLTIYSVIGQNKNGKSKYKRLKSSIQRLFTKCKPHEMLYSLLPFPKYFRKYFSLCVQGFAF